ncbi:MAG: DUF1295 domain-containing protein [Shimia sp.]|uniref:DUF1295 domain-containing protein n=1 Tax=Shimia sp. TaxID=1954381 RepID=UPI004057D6FD
MTQSPHSPEKRSGVIRDHEISTAPKSAFAVLHLMVMGICTYLAFGSFEWANMPRALLLWACAALYFLRHILTLFVLLKRRVEFGEAIGLSLFIAVFEIGFLLLGAGVLSGTPAPLGGIDVFAIALVLIGSYLNTGSELQRHRWKQDPANAGKCYTGGLFRTSMHINYFGDTVLFTGWAMLTTSWIAAIVPIGITLGFVFYHIPGLDAYLADRYGDAFKEYAARTAKFVPFIY